jgi:GWxTD domain-containing protein
VRVLAFGLSFSLLASAFSALTAQSPADRLTLDRFRDSLAGVTDTTALRHIEWDLRRRIRREPADGLLPLKAGLAALRLGELAAEPDGARAIAGLRSAASRHPDWPFAWYGLGLAQAMRSRWEQSNPIALGNRVGVGTLERAAQSHRRALQADATFLPAALALADIALRLRDTALVSLSRNALRRSAAVPEPDPQLLLAWARLERAADDPDSADAGFERYLASGANRALGLLELARTRLAEGAADAESSYFDGAALDDSLAVAGYRADLLPIAMDSELIRFDRLHGAERAEYLRRFWADRDALELRRDGERIREHYRRLLHARRNFALTVSRRFYGDADAYRSGSEEVDDRGIIYVRHGEPAERLRPFVFGLMPNESWRYARADGDLLFHFSAGSDENGGGDLYDYRLVESVLDLHGASDAPIDQLLLSRQSLSPVYGRMLNWGAYGSAKSRSRERGIGQASIAFGTTTDSYELQFDRPLVAAANLVAVGGDGDARLGHFVFAVGEPGSKPEIRGGAVTYQVRARVVAFDAGGRALARADTMITFELRAPLAPGQYLIGRVPLILAPGPWSWRAALQQGNDAGVVLPRDSVRVTGGGPALSLSDLALGARAASAIWHPTPGDTVFLTPFDLFREGSEVELYYEASGVTPGARYGHRIGVFRLKGDPPVPEHRAVVTLAFEEPASGTVARSSRTLQLGRLKPGRYVVEVEITGPGEESATRRREFQVVKKE